MTEDGLPLAELLAKAGDGLGRVTTKPAQRCGGMVQRLMETEIDGLAGADQHDRTDESHDIS